MPPRQDTTRSQERPGELSECPRCKGTGALDQQGNSVSWKQKDMVCSNCSGHGVIPTYYNGERNPRLDWKPSMNGHLQHQGLRRRIKPSIIRLACFAIWGAYVAVTLLKGKAAAWR